MLSLSPRDHESKLSSLLFWSASAGMTAYYVWQYRQKRQQSERGLPAHLLDPAVHPYVNQLQVALRLAHQAANNMMGYYTDKGTIHQNLHNLQVQTKSSHQDFCTQVDLDNEQLIFEGLRKRFPSHALIGEESVGTGQIPKLSKTQPTWIVDPVDGTTNFASGLPLSCVSLGYCENGQPVLGVVVAPMTNEVYIAVKGHGAYRNGVRIQATNKTTNDLTNAVVCVEYGYVDNQPEKVNKLLACVKNLLLHGCKSIRGLGSGVLDMCYVATGRLDAVYAGVAGEGWKPWDYCAGLIICQEAKCCVEAIEADSNNGVFDLYSESIICATSKELVEELRRVIRQ